MSRATFHFCLLLILFVCVNANSADPPPQFDPEPIVSLLELVIDADAESAGKCLNVLTAKIQSGELKGENLRAIQQRLKPALKPILAGKPDAPLFLPANSLAASWGEPAAVAAISRILKDKNRDESDRIAALNALAASGATNVVEVVSSILVDEKSSADFRGAALSSLVRLEDDAVATMVVARYARMDEDLRPRAVELLTQRPAWSKQLLTAIGRKQIPQNALNVNQVGKLLSSRDQELVKLVTATWGSVRTERDPQREKLVAEMREFLSNTHGNPENGQRVFQKLCGQCHKIHGQGQTVGPDITSNGRASFEQLLSNVFDPSLVIGAAYQARQVITDDGRVLTGLLAEDNEQRIVLKLQGGKLETIARDSIDELQISKLSMMPEGIEKQLKPQEIADLFSYLVFDRPPQDPTARLIPGAPQLVMPGPQ